MNSAAEEQLRQIAKASPHPGVHSGDLINKPVTRWLIAASNNAVLVLMAVVALHCAVRVLGFGRSLIRVLIPLFKP